MALRVALYGNLCNNLYQIGKALRRDGEFDVHLFIDSRSDGQQLPESDDPELAGNYPDWIHRGNYDGIPEQIAPWRSPLVKALSDFDLAIVSHLGPMFAQFTDTPTFFLTAGWDVTTCPFPARYWFWYPRLRSKLRFSWIGYWQRRGIRRVTEIWTEPFSPYTSALDQLGVPPSKVAPVYFPLPIDTRKFSVDTAARTRPNDDVRQILLKFDFVVFHPSRLMIRPDPRLKAVGQWKQNDLLLRGFAEFLARSKAPRAGLVLIDRDASPDVAIARTMIAQLGIEPHVLWLKPRSQSFTRDELIPLYSIADAVADDFGIGWMGSVTLEALALSRPLIARIDETVIRGFYPWHPVLSADSPEGIGEHLLSLYASPDFRQERGALGRRWIEEFHAPEKAGATYVQRISTLVRRKALGKPRG